MKAKAFRIELEFPNIWKTTKNVVKAFWQAAKIFRLHALLCVITFIVIIAWILGANIWLEGSAVVLFIYTFYNVLHLNAERIYIQKLKKLLDENGIKYDD